MNNTLPESEAKNRFRALLFRRRTYLPLPLLVRGGECAVQVGTPRLEQVEKLAELVGRRGRVLIVEASKRAADSLRAHVEASRLDWVTVVRKGAWKEKGKARLILARSPLDHRVEDETVVHDNDLVPGNYVGFEEVELDTLDSIAREHGIDRIHFVSITVNGAELNVLKGMERLLESTDRLFVKAHARMKSTGEPLNRRVSEFLRERGFRTIITRRSKSRVSEVWGDREGDVFAWRE